MQPAQYLHFIHLNILRTSDVGVFEMHICQFLFADAFKMESVGEGQVGLTRVGWVPPMIALMDINYPMLSDIWNAEEYMIMDLYGNSWQSLYQGTKIPIFSQYQKKLNIVTNKLLKKF